MNKLIFTVLFLFAMSTTGTQAQSTFDKAMTDLHKTAINTCGMIKSKAKHDDAKVLKSLKAFKELAASDRKKFVKSPPPEYANDFYTEYGECRKLQRSKSQYSECFYAV
jgi:hypothetical protein